MLALGGSGDTDWRRWRRVLSMRRRWMWLNIQRTEKLGFNNLLYLGDVANLRLGSFAVNTDKIQRNPEQI
jgi:hypothetical protein